MSLKVWHLVHGRPIGPTWMCVLEEPAPIEPEKGDPYGTWWEKTTLEQLVEDFAKHVVYAKENFPAGYFPYELKVQVRK